jgi:hypothetical protein
VLPPDPDAGAVPVLGDGPVEPDQWDALSVFDLIDPADRADLDRLSRLDWPEHLHDDDGAVRDPAAVASVVARVADGVDAAGVPVDLTDAV